MLLMAVNEDLMELVQNAPSNEVKENLLRIKTDETYDKNVKNLWDPEVPALKDVLIYLRTKENRKEYDYSPQDYLKTGLIHEIINAVSRMLIY